MARELEKTKEETEALKAKLRTAAQQSQTHAATIQDVISLSIYATKPVANDNFFNNQIQMKIQSLHSDLQIEKEQLHKIEKDNKRKKKVVIKEEKELDSLRGQLAELQRMKTEAENNRISQTC